MALPSPVLPTHNLSTGMSRPTACGLSDDTMWTGRGEPSILPRRDGPSLFSRSRRAEDGVGGRLSDPEREPSQLHPYVRSLVSFGS